MALKVIGAGFGRTGTLSLKAALEKLGYNKCHHMQEVISNPAQARLWFNAARQNNTEWDKVFDGYEACVDFPSSSYYYELAQYYPDAKVILTTRSAESWHSSASATIYAVNKLMPRWLRAVIPMFNHIHVSILKKVWQEKFDNQFEDINYAAKVFNQHIEDVKRLIPAERLLVMHISEGWAPLCKFLGKEMPSEPFPRVNDANEFNKIITGLKLLRALPWVVATIILATPLLYVYL
jgi:hypothetical protein